MTTSLFSLKGKTALITGSSRGLGRTMALTLAQAGAAVAVNSRRAKDLEQVVAEIEKSGGRAMEAAFDVTDEAALTATVERIVQTFGKIDILVNNAGIIQRKMLMEISTEEWHRVIDTNLTASFVLAREVGKHMQKQGYGKIVNLASVMAVMGRASVGSYVSSKHAIVGLTKNLAAELGPNITVNAIAPGYMRTDITEALQQDQAFNAMFLQRTTAKRWGEPHDLDGVLLLLCSDASAYITGQTLVVDGGLTSVLA